MNRVTKTLLKVMRIEVLLGIGLVMWVFSIEAAAGSIDRFKIAPGYLATWVFDDHKRNEKFVLTYRGGYMEEKVWTLGTRQLTDVQKPATLKVRGRDGKLQIMTRTGIVLMTGQLKSPDEMSDSFSNGEKFTARKYDADTVPEIWHLVNDDNKRKKCGGFFNRKPVGSCMISNGLGSYTTYNILWSYPSTFNSKADCHHAENLYWEEVCPSD